MSELKIPKEHEQYFESFITLPNEMKGKLVEQLGKSQIGTTPRMLLNQISKEIKEISKERILGILQIYISLVNSKNNIDGNLDSFIDGLEIGLKNTGNKNLTPTDSVLNDFKNLLSVKSNVADTINIINQINENPKTFIDLSIYQDVRFVLDSSGDLGGALIHNFKFTVKENKTNVDLFIALDDNDLNSLSQKIKQAQENAQKLKLKIANATIIDINDL